jgi:hypothetical protein
VARVRLPSLVASVRAMPYGIWRFGVAMVGLTFLTPYAALFVHYLVLTDLGAEASGWMQAAIGISLAVRTVLGSAHPVFLTPNVNRGGPPEQRMRWANDYQKTLCLLVGLVLPPLLLFPDIAVRALYSAEFGAAAQVVFLFVLVEIVTLLAGTYQALVLALDRLGYHVAQNVMAQAIMIAVGALAIRPLGIAGAALAALSAQAFLFASTALFLRHTFALRIAPRSALLTAYVVAAVVIAGLIGRTTTGLDLSALALRAATYVGLVAGLTVFLTTADYRRLRELARELSSRALKATRS